MTMEEMVARYEAIAAANTYALGFIYAKELYVAIMDFQSLSRFFKSDRAAASKGGFRKVRIRMTAAQREELAATAEKLGSMNLLFVDEHHNKGDNFERELTERWTTEKWVKNSTPFTVAGDIRVNGVEIQVKFDGAELTNEKAVVNLAVA